MSIIGEMVQVATMKYQTALCPKIKKGEIYTIYINGKDVFRGEVIYKYSKNGTTKVKFKRAMK